MLFRSGQPYVDVPHEASTGKPDAANIPSVCKCGYPLSLGSVMCPNCHQPVLPNASDPAPSTPPQQPAPGRRGTIDPFSNGGGFFDSCKLTPIVNPGEAKPAPLSFSGTTVLNRGNVDPNNMTITSREQAELTCRDGKWYLKDKSDQQTTFVRKKGEIELEEGDIILIGNKRFVFGK